MVQVPLVRSKNSATLAGNIALWIARRIEARVANDRSKHLSRTLRRAVSSRKVSKNSAVAEVPHYWAPAYHDGRGIARPRRRRGGVLVWFKDPINDPRLFGGQAPLTRPGRLTKAQFQVGLRENRKRPRSDPFMIIAKASPRFASPRRSVATGKTVFTRQNPFFERAFDAELRKTGARQMDDGTIEMIGDVIDSKTRHNRAPFVKKKARFRI